MCRSEKEGPLGGQLNNICRQQRQQEAHLRMGGGGSGSGNGGYWREEEDIEAPRESRSWAMGVVKERSTIKMSKGGVRARIFRQQMEEQKGRPRPSLPLPSLTAITWSPPELKKVSPPSVIASTCGWRAREARGQLLIITGWGREGEGASNRKICSKRVSTRRSQ